MPLYPTPFHATETLQTRRDKPCHGCKRRLKPGRDGLVFLPSNSPLYWEALALGKRFCKNTNGNTDSKLHHTMYSVHPPMALRLCGGLTVFQQQKEDFPLHRATIAGCCRCVTFRQQLSELHFLVICRATVAWSRVHLWCVLCVFSLKTVVEYNFYSAGNYFKYILILELILRIDSIRSVGLKLYTYRVSQGFMVVFRKCLDASHQCC